MALFKGEAKKFNIKITDADAVVADPALFDDVRVWLYELKTDTLIEKWSVAGASGYADADVTTDDDGDKVVQIHLDDAKTALLPDQLGKAVIQVTIYDTYSDGKDKIITRKGLYTYTKEAITS